MSNVAFNAFGYKSMLLTDLKHLHVFFVENSIERW